MPGMQPQPSGNLAKITNQKTKDVEKDMLKINFIFVDHPNLFFPIFEHKYFFVFN